VGGHDAGVRGVLCDRPDTSVFGQCAAAEPQERFVMANPKQQNPGNPGNTDRRDDMNDKPASQAGQRETQPGAAGASEKNRDVETDAGRQDQGARPEEGNRKAAPSRYGRDQESKSPEREEKKNPDAGNTSGGKHDA
jgi:hypothetical protein